MTTVRVYHPDISVTLYKTIKRTKLDSSVAVSARYQGIDQKIDLTPYMGEAGSVRLSKSVREPAGGFVVTLADIPYDGALSFETLAGIIEPMDFIEFRMRHSARSGGGDIPVVMRGFISDVQRVEAIGPDGKPMRSVTLSGQDYGKLWQQMRIAYLPGYVIGQETLSNFKLFERFGVGMKTTQKAGEFVTEVVQKILNPYLAALMPENTPNPKEIKLDISVKHGTTSVTGAQNREDTIYGLLRFYSDVGIWNELYLEDREDGVYCVYRPNPYKSVAGKMIQDDAPDVPVIDVLDTDIISMSVGRSDANVANYYWVRGPVFELATDIYRRQAATRADDKTVLLKDYPNSAEKLYGIRLMFEETQQGGDDVNSFKSGEDAAGDAKRDTSVANWINDRRRIMVEQNKDNVVFERGTIRMRGNEEIKAGNYIRVKRGSFQAEYYVVQHDIEYIPFQGFFSTLLLERGTGFIERAKREGGLDSPYFAELLDTK